MIGSPTRQYPLAADSLGVADPIQVQKQNLFCFKTVFDPKPSFAATLEKVCCAAKTGFLSG